MDEKRQRLSARAAQTTPKVRAMQLVFLHGFPLDGRMWGGQLDLLPGAVCCPTLYRFGNSIEAWATGVLESMEDAPAIVVGSSMGGSCALQMARQQADRIEAIVLVGAKAGHRPEPALRDGYIDLLRRGGAAAMWARVGPDFFGPQADPRVIEEAKELALAQSAGNLIKAMEAFHGRADLTDVVASWQKPLLIIDGDRFGSGSAEKATAMARLAPDGRAQIHKSTLIAGIFQTLSGRASSTLR